MWPIDAESLIDVQRGLAQASRSGGSLPR